MSLPRSRRQPPTERHAKIAGPRWKDWDSAVHEPVSHEAAITERKYPPKRGHGKHHQAANTDALFPGSIARDIGQGRAPVDVHRADSTPGDASIWMDAALCVTVEG